MIFVTVGSMLPFDRLIRVMDEWASRHPEHELFAQTGDGTYKPKNFPSVRMLSPTEFAECVEKTVVLVAHAGTGSIITALEVGRPIVILPRLAANREHTTDHQLHTVEYFGHREGVFTAMTDAEIDDAMERAMAYRSDDNRLLSTSAPEPFLARIRNFLAT